MKSIINILSLFITSFAMANIHLPAIFADGMVLQRNAEVTIWGNADPREEITLKADFLDKEYKVKAANDATFKITFKTPKEGGPYTISLKGYNEVSLKNVMLGEVWLMSGQSNMEMSAAWGIKDGDAEMAKANYPNIRFFTARKSSAEFPQKDIIGNWATCTPETAKNWLQATGHPILEGWGMSETIGVGTANPFTNKEFNGSIGMPLPGVDINIRNEDENVLEIGTIGEICIKGDNVITSYHNIDNVGFFTADCYLKTGDIGAMDEKGYVRIYDRKKDIIIVSGFNVYPNEVENVIEKHPKVAECSVVGVVAGRLK